MYITGRKINKERKLVVWSLLLILIFLIVLINSKKQQKKELENNITQKLVNLNNLSGKSELCKVYSENSQNLTDKYCISNKKKSGCKLQNISLNDMIKLQKDLDNLIAGCTKSKSL